MCVAARQPRIAAIRASRSVVSGATKSAATASVWFVMTTIAAPRARSVPKALIAGTVDVRARPPASRPGVAVLLWQAPRRDSTTPAPVRQRTAAKKKGAALTAAAPRASCAASTSAVTRTNSAATTAEAGACAALWTRRAARVTVSRTAAVPTKHAALACAAPQARSAKATSAARPPPASRVSAAALKSKLTSRSKTSLLGWRKSKGTLVSITAR